MSRLWARFSGIFINRTFIGIDKSGNRYFTRTEEIDGISESLHHLYSVNSALVLLCVSVCVLCMNACTKMKNVCLLNFHFPFVITTFLNLMMLSSMRLEFMVLLSFLYFITIEGEMSSF